MQHIILNKPDGAEPADTIADLIRNSRDELIERINIEHYPINSTKEGEHLPGKCSVVYVGSIDEINLLEHKKGIIVINSTTKDVLISDGVNWIIVDAIKVKSFNGRVGDIVSQIGDYNTSQIVESLDKKYITESGLTKLNNTSGVNTGDETEDKIKTKLGEVSSTHDGYMNMGLFNSVSQDISNQLVEHLITGKHQRGNCEVCYVGTNPTQFPDPTNRVGCFAFDMATSKLYCSLNNLWYEVNNGVVNNDNLSNVPSKTVKGRINLGSGLVSDIPILPDLKTALELDNVNNTSDVNKPISTATQIALDNKISDKPIANIGGSIGGIPVYFGEVSGTQLINQISAGDTDSKITVAISTDGKAHIKIDANSNKIVGESTDTRLTDARVPIAHAHAASDVTSGILDGDRLPIISTNKKGAVPATGIPAGKYLKDDGTWAVIAIAMGSGLYWSEFQLPINNVDWHLIGYLYPHGALQGLLQVSADNNNEAIIIGYSYSMGEPPYYPMPSNHLSAQIISIGTSQNIYLYAKNSGISEYPNTITNVSISLTPMIEGTKYDIV